MRILPHPGHLRRVVLALLVCVAAGCGATPRDRFAAADRALLAAHQSATAAIKAGYFDDKPDVLKAVQFGLNEANAAAAQAKPLALAGNDPGLDFWIDRVLAGVERVAVALGTKKGTS
jgi:hypothetical protein